ncbi:hypothetical protein [Bacillus velezensis]|uniref:hypothetical protein n=1 Tax=Bacillus velezensis TaxID=492670 RepID=UPI003C6BFDD2
MNRLLRHDYFVHNNSHITYATMTAIIVVPLFFLLFTVFYHKRSKPIGEKADPERLKSFLAEEGGNALSHLGFLGDKRFISQATAKRFYCSARFPEGLSCSVIRQDRETLFRL